MTISIAYGELNYKLMPFFWYYCIHISMNAYVNKLCIKTNIRVEINCTCSLLFFKVFVISAVLRMVSDTTVTPMTVTSTYSVSVETTAIYQFTEDVHLDCIGTRKISLAITRNWPTVKMVRI